MPSAAFIAWAAARDTRKIYAAELAVRRLSDGQDLTLRVATDGAPWDGSHYYEPCLETPPRLTHRAQHLTHGRALAAYGQMVLAVEQERVVHPSGITLSELLSGDYALAGREVVVRVGGPELAWSDWAVVLRGVMGEPRLGEARCSLPIQSRAQAVVDAKLPPGRYGAGSSSRVQDRPIPLCWGTCRNISPVQTDDAGLAYQVHDGNYGPIQAVDAVYVNGKQVTTGFTVDLSAGTITFSSDPGGRVTADVRGRMAGGSWLQYPGEIIQDILTTLGPVATEDLDAASFSAFDSARPWPVGIYLDRETSLMRAVDSLLTGLMAICGPDRDGTWRLQAFAAPSGDPVLEISDSEGLGLQIRPEERLLQRVAVLGDRCWTTDSNPDATVSAARRAWLRDRFRQRAASDSSIQTTWPLAGEEEVESHLIDLADCASCASLWLGLFGQGRRVISITTKLQPLAVKLGDVVRVRSERYGLADGRLARVVGITEDHAASRMTLEAWL